MAFVGREPELARLAGALERSARGERSSIALVGSAGFGLTRLLDEVVARLADLPDLVIVRGAAHEPRAGEPYAALGDALRALVARVPDGRLSQVVEPAGPILAPLVRDLPDRLARQGLGPLSPPLVASPEQAGGRFVEAVVGLLERLAGPGTILLILEDLHWADPGTRQFIDTLLRIGRPARLCLVVTYRPEELHVHHPVWDFAQTTMRNPAIETVEVRPLDRGESIRLLEVLLGERPSAALVAAAMEGSGGNPLLIEQLAVAHQGGLRVRLSEPFVEIFRARLEPLSVGARRCLHVLAAARRPLPVGLIRRLELPAGRLPQDAIEEALASGLAQTVEATGRRAQRSGRAAETNGRSARRSSPTLLRGGQLVGLAHEQYAEALGGLGLPADRQPVHAILARALTGYPAEQAWHLEAAMRFAAARNAHLEAGLEAEVIEPGPTALLHFQRVLELVDAHEPRVPSLSMSLPELLARSAEAAFAANQSRRAAGLLEQAISAATAVGRLERAALAGDRRRALESEIGQRYVRLGQIRSAAGDLPGAVAAVESAVEIIPPTRRVERGHALAVLAQQLMLDGRFEQSARAARRVREAASDPATIAIADLGSAACTLGVDLGYLGDVDGGLALLEEATELAERAGRLDDLMRAYANRTHLLDLQARAEEALSVAERGIAAAGRWGVEATYGAFLRGSAAGLLFGLGRWAEAEAEARTALEWSPGRLAPFSLHILGAVLVEARADEEASQVVGQILLKLEETSEGQWTAPVQRIAVSAALWRDDPAEAVRIARRGWEQVREDDDWRQVVWAASTTAEASAALADAARTHHDVVSLAAMAELAAEVVSEADRRLARGLADRAPAAAGEARLHAATAQLHLARCRGRHDAAAWASVAEGWHELQVPYLEAKAHWWQAEAALQAGERRAARAALGRSWALACALPARPLMRELRRLARRARINLADPLPLPELDEGLDGSGRLVAVGPGTAAAGGPGGEGVGLTALSERLQISPAAPLDPFHLSPRELEVLALIVQGATNRDVARRLFISERTVGVHVRNILGKLGVTGRIEAANVAIRLGLVPVPASVRLAPGG